MKIAIVSGGFDPLHHGHVQNILAAREYGHVIVILNSDEWLCRKKGKQFMDYVNREAVAGNITGVIDIVKAKDDDNTVCESLRELRKRFPYEELTFCKGGDRVVGNVPEVAVCEELGINIAYNVGGTKVYSSRDFLKEWDERNKEK